MPSSWHDSAKEIMTSTAWPVHSPFAKEHFGRGKAEGKAEGEADAILLVLKARGLAVTEAEHDRIMACTDLRQLQTWVTRAATAEKTSDLFQ